MRLGSLRRRVVVLALAAVGSVVILVDVALTLSLREELDREVDRALDARVAFVEELADENGVAELAAALRERDYPAVITAPDGTVARVELPTGPPNVPVATTEVTLPDGTHVEIQASRDRVWDVERRVLLTALAGSLVAVVGAAVLLELYADRVLRPLDEIVETAREISRGRTGARLGPADTETEVGRLATAFDEMLESQEAALHEALSAEDRSRRFLADAAHQLRTPVAGLRAATETLLRDAPDAPDRDRLLEHLARESARTGRLLDGLLRVAALDRGRPAERAGLDLAALVHEEVERQRPLAPSLRITVDAPQELAIEGDADGLREAVANLLDNARRHAESSIDIEVAAYDGHARIRVADDGPGLAPGDEEAAFDRFVSLDGRGGSGLGLPIARGVARAHGGDVAWRDGAFELTVAPPEH